MFYKFVSGVVNNQMYGPEDVHILHCVDQLYDLKEVGVYEVAATGQHFFWYDGLNLHDLFSAECPMRAVLERVYM